MRHEVTVPIAAAAATAWHVLADLEQWPSWTASMTSVQPIGGGPLATGLPVKVKQPKLREVVMEVTEVDPGRSFTWVSRSTGIVTTAVHEIAETGRGTSEVTLTFEMVGPLGRIAGTLFGGLIRRYVQMEADGLARAAGSTT